MPTFNVLSTRPKYVTVPYTLDNVLGSCIGAYSTRRIANLSTYAGPIASIRRSSDSATMDVYFGSPSEISAVQSFLGSNIGYVVWWYDQSGKGNHAAQVKIPEYQPTFTVYNNRFALNFDGLKTSLYFTLNTANLLAANNFTVCVSEARTSSKSSTNYYFGGYGTAASTNLVLGYLNDTTLNLDTFAANVQATTGGYTSNAFELVTHRHSSTISNNILKNGVLVGNSTATSANLTSISGTRIGTGGIASIARTWVQQVTISAAWQDMCWSPEKSLFVAVNNNSTAGVKQVMYSPDGVTWTSTYTYVNTTWYGIAWSKELSLFVAVGQSTSSSGGIMTSPDAINWTVRTQPSTGQQWNGICWAKELGSGLFVVTSSSSNTVMTSPDGINWTVTTTTAPIRALHVIWSKELALLVAVGAASNCMTSTDGTTWTARALGANLTWRSVAWSPTLSIFAAVANGGTTSNSLATSSDGFTWTLQTAPQNNFSTIVYAAEAEIFMVATTGNGSTNTTYVYDGTTMVQYGVGFATTNVSFPCLAWAPSLGRFVLVRNNGTDGYTLDRTPFQGMISDIVLFSSYVSGTTRTTLESALFVPTSGQYDWVYITPGAYTLTIPTEVTSICVVCVGGGGGGSNGTKTAGQYMGGGGGGGGLAYYNNYAVTPGGTLTINVGSGGTASTSNSSTTNSVGGNGGASFVIVTSSGIVICQANGGIGGALPNSGSAGLNAAGGTTTGAAGYVGYSGGSGYGTGTVAGTYGGGGGAGGWSGAGGNAGTGSNSGGNPGTGGSGAGGNGDTASGVGTGAGGGVEYSGQGVSGTIISAKGTPGGGGGNGSAGNADGSGGQYGGGGSGGANGVTATQKGGNGFVRIMAGGGRTYPFSCPLYGSSVLYY